jgi:serine/threonine protein kinase
VAARRIAEFVASVGIASVGSGLSGPGSETSPATRNTERASVPGRLAPGTRADRYEVEDVLGAGGMAVVYRARHVQLGTFHAIKVLTVPSPEIRERLLVEGRVQATIRSPNIVPVTDVIDVGGAPGLVMELVDGPTLADLLRRGPLPLDQVDALARGIMAGVCAAHRAGLIHRDLKPANILLAQSDGGLIPKIADFGLAKVLDATASSDPDLARTQSRTTLGTPQYMSPEQIRSAKSVDTRSDLWSLGAILYEMVTGARAFAGPDVISVFVAITEGRYQPVQAIVPTAPARMLSAIDAALRVDPAERIEDVERLAAIWDGEVANEAASPKNVPLPRVAPDRTRRRARWLLGSIGGLVSSVVLLAGLRASVPSPFGCPELAGSYMPLAVGNRWHYSMVQPESGRRMADKWLEIDTEVADLGGANAGVQGFRVSRKDGEGTAVRWLGRKDDVVAWFHDVWTDKDGKRTKDTYYQPFRTRVDERCEHRVAGARWTEEYDNVSLDPVAGTPQATKRTPVEWTVEATDEMVTVPAGTFETIRVRRSTPDEVQTFWFAAGVGKVMEETPNKEHEELLSYHLE